MLTTRAHIIKAERAVVIETIEHTALKPGDRIYLLEFVGGAVKLKKTGLYVRTTNRGSERTIRRREETAVLIFVAWDGDKEESRHPVDRLGLMLTSESFLVVKSLKGIDWKEDRPLSRRHLHTPR
ncbi:MAG TPA: hypothetical protein VM581_03480 [Magnetospirillaceae bacterium]|nr:hypothetical protein [Magnetospirillaceae bacterium]